MENIWSNIVPSTKSLQDHLSAYCFGQIEGITRNRTTTYLYMPSVMNATLRKNNKQWSYQCAG